MPVITPRPASPHEASTRKGLIASDGRGEYLSRPLMPVMLTSQEIVARASKVCAPSILYPGDAGDAGRCHVQINGGSMQSTGDGAANCG